MFLGLTWVTALSIIYCELLSGYASIAQYIDPVYRWVSRHLLRQCVGTASTPLVT